MIIFFARNPLGLQIFLKQHNVFGWDHRVAQSRIQHYLRRFQRYILSSFNFKRRHRYGPTLFFNKIHPSDILLGRSRFGKLFQIIPTEHDISNLARLFRKEKTKYIFTLRNESWQICRFSLKGAEANNARKMILTDI